jgi:predicted nucleotidyltransferase
MRRYGVGVKAHGRSVPGDDLRRVVVFGSKARGEAHAESDIDVLIIGSPSTQTLAEVVGKLEHQLGREINYTVLSRQELKAGRKRKDAFLESVWQNKRIGLVDSHQAEPHEKAQAAHRRLGPD